MLSKNKILITVCISFFILISLFFSLSLLSYTSTYSAEQSQISVDGMYAFSKNTITTKDEAETFMAKVRNSNKDINYVMPANYCVDTQYKRSDVQSYIFYNDVAQKFSLKQEGVYISKKYFNGYNIGENISLDLKKVDGSTQQCTFVIAGFLDDFKMQSTIYDNQFQRNKRNNGYVWIPANLIVIEDFIKNPYEKFFVSTSFNFNLNIPSDQQISLVKNVAEFAICDYETYVTDMAYNNANTIKKFDIFIYIFYVIAILGVIIFTMVLSKECSFLFFSIACLIGFILEILLSLLSLYISGFNLINISLLIIIEVTLMAILYLSVGVLTLSKKLNKKNKILEINNEK
ncbi:MAG: hypothetical protein RR454_00725 [Clostridia bacterium]